MEAALSSIQGLRKELTVMTYEKQMGLQTVKTSFTVDTKEVLHEELNIRIHGHRSRKK
jgi:hypothetical protein